MSEAAGSGAAGPLDQVRALAVLAARLLHAPWAVVALVEGGTCTATSWVRLVGDAPPPGEDAQRSWGEALAGGAGMVVPDLRAAPDGTLDPGAGVRAWAGAALAPGEQPLGAPGAGVLAVADDAARGWTPADLEVLHTLAAAAAAVLQQARQRHTAEVLQRSLLPVLPVLPELDLASAYRPAEGAEVGGDFFDAVDLGAGRVAVCIGDVMGRGVRAAAVTGQLRTAVRAYARLDVPPGRLLGQLNALVEELADAQLATCFYGVLDVAAGTLTYASAGHLAPLLRREGAASVLAGPVGAPLGGDARPYAEAVVRVQPGDLLCLYTDGLVEDRTRDLDEGLRLAAQVLLEADDRDGRGLAARCERLLEAVAGGQEDDVALLLVRLPGAAESAAARVRELEVPGGGTSVVGHVRHWAGGTVRSWHADEHLASTAALVVSELVTNALLHGLPPVRVRLRSGADALSVEVFDQGSVLPDRGDGEPDEESGRGLLLVEVLSSRWGTRASGPGKVVWAELPLPGELPEDVPDDLPVAGPDA